MSLFVRFFALFIFWLNLAVAQTDYSFRSQGSFTITSQSFIPTTVNYVMEWNEIGNRIAGVYSDNFFSPSAPVNGSSSMAGRSFVVTLPNADRGVQSISMVTSQIGLYNGDITMTVTTRNAASVPVDVANVEANMTSRVLSTAAGAGAGTSTCIVDFGVLSGFCGSYAGTIVETVDTNGRCDLLGGGVTNLVLLDDRSLRLNFAGKVHDLGNIPPSLMLPNINLNKRNCGPLVNTTFFQNNCQIMNLTGSFMDMGETKGFQGTYTITDEVNGNTCAYNFNLLRD